MVFQAIAQQCWRGQSVEDASGGSADLSQDEWGHPFEPFPSTSCVTLGK